MKQFSVSGMSCAACSARVEKAVRDVAGVTACQVNLLTNSMTVDGNVDTAAILNAVEAAGYRAAPKDVSPAASQPTPPTSEMRPLTQRLVASLLFLAVLMYLSMGHMLSLPLPAFLATNPLANGLCQLLLAAAVMVINQAFFVRGWNGLLHRAPNMDTLVALGSAAAFAYSVYALLAMTVSATPAHYLHEFYFESAAMILTLITVGKLLEAHSKGRTTDALKGLMKLAPQTAVLRQNGEDVLVPITAVKTGDVFVVKPGESIPVDGRIVEGGGAVDEAALTGESVPVDKAVGDAVSAATINRSGFLVCEATRVGEDTTLSQIIRMVSDAAATKAPIAKVADRVSGVFVPIVLGVALLTAIVWLLAGQSVGFALARGISVLVISCPCALGLATPVAIMVGSGVGAKHGILFKNATALETAGHVNTVVLDKTGTVTAGTPVLTDLLPAPGVDEETLLQAAVSLEKKSEHPLAQAIVAAGAARDIPLDDVTDFAVFPGHGLTAKRGGQTLRGGNAAYIREATAIPAPLHEAADALAADGKTPLFFAEDDRLLGMLAVADTLRPDSVAAVAALHRMGLRVVMLTGDNTRTAAAIGRAVGVDEVIAEVLPHEKEATIRRLQASGRVAMVGDGINDAPALTRADVGMAIGAGTDIAMDAADVVLMNSRATDIPSAIKLGRASLRVIHQNLFWAFVYNLIGIPLAAGVFIPLFGWQLNPMFGAAAMSLSSFCVVTNALRLNRFHAIRPSANGLTVHVKGMMCGHCEARVKTALECLPFVEQAICSHQTGTAVLTLNGTADIRKLKAALKAEGYKVTKIET